MNNLCGKDSSRFTRHTIAGRSGQLTARKRNFVPLVAEYLDRITGLKDFSFMIMRRNSAFIRVNPRSHLSENSCQFVATILNLKH